MDLAIAIHRLNPAAEYTLTDDKSAIREWRHTSAKPTPAQLQAAWDAYAAEQQQAATQAETERQTDTTERDALADALAAIDAYLALATPTAAQNLGQIRLLSRAARFLLRREMRRG